MVFYPKRTDKEIYKNLVIQCEKLDINFVNAMPVGLEDEYSLIVDAIFGFSFSGNNKNCLIYTAILSLFIPKKKET